jgi:hypothetical protein
VGGHDGVGPARDGKCLAPASHFARVGYVHASVGTLAPRARIGTNCGRNSTPGGGGSSKTLVQPVPQEQDGGDGEQVPLQVPANAKDTGVPTVVAAVDEANDGDDGDSNDDDDDDDEELQGNTANFETGKRAADDLEGDTSSAGRKRRKL